MDIYKTLLRPSAETLFKEKNSKFFGYAFPAASEDDVKNYLSILRKKHPGAGHFCYAYQIGTDNISFRANDDGEPGNSAGMPIYGQIQSFGLTNVLVCVVRYFGGVKLGVGGLMSAYKAAAQMTLEGAEIIEKTIDIHYTLLFDYKNLNKVMRIIKERKLEIISQKMDLNCEIEIATPRQNAEEVSKAFRPIFEVTIKRP